LVGVGVGDGEFEDVTSMGVELSEAVGVWDALGVDVGEPLSFGVGDGESLGDIEGVSLGWAISVGAGAIKSAAIVRATCEKSMRIRKPANARFNLYFRSCSIRGKGN
jgi:hypothetical protein